jgi:hypothetical protein
MRILISFVAWNLDGASVALAGRINQEAHRQFAGVV